MIGLIDEMKVLLPPCSRFYNILKIELIYAHTTLYIIAFRLRGI